MLSFVKYLLCFLILINSSRSQVLTKFDLTPLTIGFQWEEISSSIDAEYTLKDLISGDIIFTTQNTFMEMLILEVGRNYQFQVCRNINDNLPTPTNICTSNTINKIITSSSLNPGADDVVTVPIDGTLALFYWARPFSSPTTNYESEVFYVQYFFEGKWEYASAEIIENSGTVDQGSVVLVLTKPGETLLYRFFIEGSERSDSFFYTSPYRISSNSDNFFGATKRSYDPSNSPNVQSLSVPNNLVYSFNDPNVPSICNLIGARFVILADEDASINNGGFINVYNSSDDSDIDINNSISYHAQFIPTYLNERFYVNFDKNIPNNGIDIINSFTAGSNNDLLLKLIDTNDASSLVISDIELELAFANPVTNIISTNDEISIDDNTTSGFCSDGFCVAPTSNNPFPTITITDNEFPFNTPPEDALVLSINITITGQWNEQYVSVGFNFGAVDDQFLPQVSSCNSEFNFQSTFYPVYNGGFPGGIIDENSIYIVASESICITDISISFDYIIEELESCDPSNPSPNPTPSLTPSVSSSRSSGSSSSISKSPTTSVSPSSSPVTPSVTATPSRTPSRTPFISAPPIPSPLPSKSPAPPASNTPANSPSRTKTPQPSSNFPDVAPTVAPDPQSPVNVVDEDGDVIGVIDLGNNPGGDDLVITPVPLDDVPNRNDIGSSIISLVLLDIFGNEVQPTSEVEICFNSIDGEDESCLGFLDESENPPVWKCQDRCLSRKDGLLCGNTDHFTSFALLLGGGLNGCSDSDDYILGDAWKDGVLIGSLTFALCCCFLIITILLAATPCGSRIVRGSEGHRISKLRGSRNLDATELEVSEP